jgi:hypothetical protein
MDENWISLRAYAKHRGVQLGAVQKAVKSGRVTCVKRDSAGRLCGIDQALADQQWAARTDPVEAARSGTMITTPAADGVNSELPLDDAPAIDGQAAAAKDGTPAFNESRRKQAYYAAEQARLDHLKELGLVVSMEEQTKVSTRRYRALRDKLQSIPDRTCDILAAERDAGVVHALLVKEINQALYELSDDARAEFAAGAAERMAA